MGIVLLLGSAAASTSSASTGSGFAASPLTRTGAVPSTPDRRPPTRPAGKPMSEIPDAHPGAGNPRLRPHQQKEELK